MSAMRTISFPMILAGMALTAIVSVPPRKTDLRC